jgi:hypothetical protein
MAPRNSVSMSPSKISNASSQADFVVERTNASKVANRRSSVSSAMVAALLVMA